MNAEVRRKKGREVGAKIRWSYLLCGNRDVHVFFASVLLQVLVGRL